MGGNGPARTTPTPPEGRGKCLLERARWPSDAHPQLKLVARESWAAARSKARVVNSPLRSTLRNSPTFLPSVLGGHRRLRAVVLVLSFRGWSTHVVTESLVAAALQGRGAHATVVTCGGRLPMCDVVPVPFAPPAPCPSISGYEHDAAVASGLHLFELSDSSALECRVRPTASATANLEQYRTTAGADLALGCLFETSVTRALSTRTVDDADPLAFANVPTISCRRASGRGGVVSNP